MCAFRFVDEGLLCFVARSFGYGARLGLVFGALTAMGCASATAVVHPTPVALVFEPPRVDRRTVIVPQATRQVMALPLATASPTELLPPPWQRWAVVVGHHQGVMLGMRLTEVWLWPEPFATTQPLAVGLRYHAAYSQSPKWATDAPWFEWDGDRWWINVVGHSLLGSELYLAARRCSFDPIESLAAAVAGSVAWEYGYEASGVRPSALDLVYTPLSGIVLGEFRYWVYHQASRLPRGPKAVVRLLVDPLGQGERVLGFPC